MLYNRILWFSNCRVLAFRAFHLVLTTVWTITTLNFTCLNNILIDNLLSEYCIDMHPEHQYKNETDLIQSMLHSIETNFATSVAFINPFNISAY